MGAEAVGGWLAMSGLLVDELGDLPDEATMTIANGHIRINGM